MSNSAGHSGPEPGGSERPDGDDAAGSFAAEDTFADVLDSFTVDGGRRRLRWLRREAREPDQPAAEESAAEGSVPAQPQQPAAQPQPRRTPVASRGSGRATRRGRSVGAARSGGGGHRGRWSGRAHDHVPQDLLPGRHPRGPFPKGSPA